MCIRWELIVCFLCPVTLRLINSAENRLRDMNLLASAGRHPIFTSLHSRGRIEDDHIPFLNRGK